MIITMIIIILKILIVILIFIYIHVNTCCESIPSPADMLTPNENLRNLCKTGFCCFLVPTSHVTALSDSSHIPKHRRQACISAMVANKALRTEDAEALRKEDKSNLPNCNVLAAFLKGHFIGIHCHHAPPKKVQKQSEYPGISFQKNPVLKKIMVQTCQTTGVFHHPLLQLLLPILAAKLPSKAASSTASRRRKKPNQWPELDKSTVFRECLGTWHLWHSPLGWFIVTINAKFHTISINLFHTSW